MRVPSRFLVTTAAEECEQVRQRLENAGVPVLVLGRVAGDALVIEEALSLPVSALEDTLKSDKETIMEDVDRGWETPPPPR